MAQFCESNSVHLEAKNYQCTDGMTPNWDCTMWAGFGTTFAYIQTGDTRMLEWEVMDDAAGP